MKPSLLRRLAALLFAVLVLSSCATGTGVPNDDGVYYTAVNIWWYKAKKIYCTNYHTGERIKVGTQVHVTNLTDKAIDFRTSSGQEFRIIYVARHTRQTMRELFQQYFSKTDPLAAGGPFARFTENERQAIKAGIIVRGMSKPAVLMAYGYPPSHKTPSLDDNLWIYFNTLYVEHKVLFENGRTVNALF